MPSLFDEETRQRIRQRLSRLTPESSPRWGRMTAGQMLCHLGDVQRIPLGDIQARPVTGVMRLRPVAYALIHWLPWPKGRVQGPPEGFATSPESFEQDRTALLDLIRQFSERDPHRKWPPHPLFGSLTGRDWGVFSYRHLDHHLQQFGI